MTALIKTASAREKQEGDNSFFNSMLIKLPGHSNLHTFNLTFASNSGIIIDDEK